MAGIKWSKNFHATLATPVTAWDLAFGLLIWSSIRILLVTAIFGLVSILFGAFSPMEGAVAVLPATLTGMAFAGPITWYTAGLEKETGLSGLFRFGIVPLFLFSGTFFPISQLPDFIEPLAFVVPLWHGVELTRSIALGTTATLPWSVHLAVLLGCTIVGAVGAADRLRRRLVV